VYPHVSIDNGNYQQQPAQLSIRKVNCSAHLLEQLLAYEPIASLLIAFKMQQWG
jgi:hypothetical protein